MAVANPALHEANEQVGIHGLLNELKARQPLDADVMAESIARPWRLLGTAMLVVCLAGAKPCSLCPSWAIALSLNACPYRAMFVLLRRSKGCFIDSTTILTYEASQFVVVNLFQALIIQRFENLVSEVIALLLSNAEFFL